MILEAESNFTSLAKIPGVLVHRIVSNCKHTSGMAGLLINVVVYGLQENIHFWHHKENMGRGTV